MSSGIENSPVAAMESAQGLSPLPTQPPVTPVQKAAALLQRGGVAAIVVLVIVVLLASLKYSSFHSADNLRNILLGNSFYAIVAIGMTLVIITGGIDLSVGSVFALGGVVGTYFAGHGNVVLAIVMTLLVCGAIGLINGVLIGYLGLAPFIVTLASLFGVRGLVLQITNAGATIYDVKPSSTFAKLGTGHWLSLGVPVFVAIVAYVVFHLLLERTSFGLTIFGIGGSEPASLLMGLKVRRVKVSLYVISAMLAGIAGMLLAAQSISADPTTAVGLELTTIASVVIGGTILTGGSGSLIGSAAGILLLGAISSVINFAQLNTNWNNVVAGGFLVVVVVVQRVLNRARTT